MEPSEYGRYYWCIKTTLSKSGEIYVHADDARILPDGTLNMVRLQGMTTDVKHINLALAPGQWSAMYAASVLDGSAVAIEHWDGEVVRGKDKG